MMTPASARILTVEDEGIVAANLKATLQELGYEVVMNVRSGEQAIEKAGQLKPDLVLMDVMLDGQMDGIEATKYIESNYRIPVVYLTAYSDKEILERAKPTNSYGYIVKPFEERNLGVTLEMALYKSKYDNEMGDYRNLISAIIKGIPSVVVVCDSAGQVIYCNWEDPVAIGKSLKELLKVKIKGKGIEDLVSQAIEQNKLAYEGNASWMHPSGETPMEIYCTPMASKSEGPTKAILILNDISEREKGERESETKYSPLLEVKNLHAYHNIVFGELKEYLHEIESHGYVLLNQHFENLGEQGRNEIAALTKAIGRTMDFIKKQRLFSNDKS